MINCKLTQMAYADGHIAEGFDADLFVLEEKIALITIRCRVLGSGTKNGECQAMVKEDILLY